MEAAVGDHVGDHDGVSEGAVLGALVGIIAPFFGVSACLTCNLIKIDIFKI